MTTKNENTFTGRTALSMKDPEREERKLKLKKQYDERYNKLKIIEFKTMDEVNRTKHFYFPRLIMEKGLSKIELALYPVLCSLADFRESNWFQVSIANLAKLSGMSTTTVQKALTYLTGDIVIQGQNREIFYSGDDAKKVSILESKLVTVGSRHHNEYKVEFFRGGIIDAK